MNKITVLESAGFFRFRLEKLMTHYDFDNVEVLGNINMKNVSSTFADSKLVIMDLDNHSIDIVSLIKEIKGHELTSHVEIILLSSQADIRTLRKALIAGCSDFVTKPFSDELLIKKVHKFMNKAYKDLGIPTMADEGQESSEIGFIWQRDYETGIESIDIEHKKIIDHYEKLYTHMKAGKGHEYYKELIVFLDSYIKEHFAHEEEYLERINYDGISEQLAFHREFEHEIEKIIRDHEHTPITNLDLIKMNLFLKDWFLEHILVEDVKIKAFLSKEQA